VHPNQADQADVGLRHVGLEPQLEIPQEEKEKDGNNEKNKDPDQQQDHPLG